MPFTRTFNTRQMTPNQLTAELRAADVQAVQELGGPVTRVKSVNEADGVMSVVWSLAPAAIAANALATAPVNGPAAASGTLGAAIERGADVIAAAVPIAKAVVDGKAMSKFAVIADRMASTRKAWDARADKILDGLNALEPAADAAFKAHEDKLAEAEAGFKSMQDAVRDLAGGNGGSAA